MLEFDQEQPRKIDPIMGYTSSGDMRQQVRLTFETQELAEAYAEAQRHRIPRDRAEGSRLARQSLILIISAITRTQPWTH